MPLTATDPIKIILAIILPPLGVFMEVGFKGHFWLNILLTLLGFIPGIIHALYVIFKHCCSCAGLLVFLDILLALDKQNRGRWNMDNTKRAEKYQ